MNNVGYTNESDKDIENICEEAIALIPSCGVTYEALAEACKRLGKEDRLYKFPNGISNVLEYMYEKLINYITTVYQNKNPEDITRIRDKIFCLLEACIQFHASFPEPQRFVKAVVRYSLAPKNTCFIASMVSKVSDAIWRLVGDQSTDFNYYTKRLSLSVTYTLSIMHMSRDTSDNFTETINFTKKRINNILAFHKFKSKAKAFLPKWLSILNVRFDR